MPSEQVKDQLKRLPAGPGVYLFRGSRDEVLYVGKAKSLRPRVRQYFQASRSDTRTGIDQLVDRTADIETIVTGTEVEALHLEQNLVKRHRPPFNVRLRDDKSFPYIAVTIEDEYPRVMFTRERHRRGVVYFGPYANAKKVRETLDVLNRVFRYRPCERAAARPAQRDPVPRLPHRALLRALRRLHLEGGLPGDHRRRDRVPLRGTTGRSAPSSSGGCARPPPRSASRRRRYRNRLRAVERLAERQAVERTSIGTIDVIGVAVGPERAAVQVFPLRGGRMVDRYSFHLENAAGEDVAGGARAVLPRVLRLGAVDPAADPRAAGPFEPGAGGVPVREARLAGEVRAPERGEKRRLQELAQQNAELALASETFVAETKRLRRVEALEELREVLNLESLPIRIECFDISNIQGQRDRRLDGRVRGRRRQEGALPQVRRPRAGRAGRLRGDGRGRLAPLRAARGGRDGRRLRRVVRGDAEPGRDRRRQGPAQRGARGDARVRPAARRRDRPREARGRRCSSPAARRRCGSRRTRRASSCSSG